MSFFVWFLYAFRAAEKIVSKFVEEVEVDGTWDIVTRWTWVARSSSRDMIDERTRAHDRADNRPDTYFLSCERLELGFTNRSVWFFFFSSNHHFICLLIILTPKASWKFTLCLGLGII